MKILVIFILALKQMAREKFILTCQIMAIAAVFIPLLIILGLKHGMISSMKQQLLSNPATLEIRQKAPFDVYQKDLQTILSWPETQFAVAMPDLNGVSVRAMKTPSRAITISDHASATTCDVLPSAPNDPLMTKSQCEVPQEGELVISTHLARQLKLQRGDSLSLSVSRNQGTQLWSRAFTVSGILPDWASARTEMYSNSELVNFIEEYQRAGKGTAGQPAEVNFNAYHALILDKNVEEAQAIHLANQSRNMRLERAKDLIGVADGTPLLRRHGLKLEGVGLNSLIEAAAQAEMPFKATPWNPALEVTLAGKPMLLLSRAELFSGSATLCPAPAQLYIHPSSTELTGTELTGAQLSIQSPDGESLIYCDLIADEGVPEGQLWASPQLSALAHQASQMLIAWDYRHGSLRYPRARSLGLRLYAKGLEETEPLYDKMQQHNFPSSARLASIRQLLELEDNLNIIFLIISGCSAFGGSLALAFNLFNAIQRRRRDYALLQLLGAGKYSMMLLPLIEALFVTFSSIMLSLGVFYLASHIVATVFAQYEDVGTICRLTPEHIIYLVLISGGLALVAALASAIRMLNISPSEIIRDN